MKSVPLDGGKGETGRENVSLVTDPLNEIYRRTSRFFARQLLYFSSSCALRGKFAAPTFRCNSFFRNQHRKSFRVVSVKINRIPSQNDREISIKMATTFIILPFLSFNREKKLTDGKLKRSKRKGFRRGLITMRYHFVIHRIDSFENDSRCDKVSIVILIARSRGTRSS